VAANDDNRRLLDLQSEQLRALQQQSGQAPAAAEPPPAAAASPGVNLETQQVFTDEQKAQSPAAAEAPAPAPAAAPPPAPRSSEPSLVDQAVGWLMAPMLWIGLGVAALLFAALWYVRRKRREPEDVTGRWDALETAVAEDEDRHAAEGLRRHAQEESIVVEESARPRRAGDADGEPARKAARPQRAAATAGAVAATAVDETLSSQTVINLDQADPVAEADFHMAYGLYDQAAELVQRALDAQPTRRDLKLKLLEVFFVWGNKDAFLAAAQDLRKEIGSNADADWDKVVIMGKQICPDERLFAETTGAPGVVDVDLEAGGDAPLDLAFDEPSGFDAGSLDAGLDFDLDSSGNRPSPVSAPRAASKPASKPAHGEDSLDIGERTAAGLEAALFEMGDEGGDEDTGRRTTPDAVPESLAVTQESPTIESPADQHGRWGDGENVEDIFSLDAPTVETPTIETMAADAPTMETPTVETPRGEPPTVEQPNLHVGGASDRTAEIDLDDLGLDIADLENLPQDLGDLPGAATAESDTREQPALAIDDDEDGLLSATGVTQVLHSEEVDEEFEQRETSVLDDQDATQLAPGYGDSTHIGTEVLENRFEFDKESGDTSLVRSLTEEEALDLNLDDLSAALHGADTVEQPRSSPFGGDVFGGGATPLDLDVGDDILGRDDPTGTEEASPLDPQTMTEVGTKLDLARAYIDMGDPEGARSILEEVLDEGDPGQRREAQSLIDVLSA
jgi:pilus assembly protein FimV